MKKIKSMIGLSICFITIIMMTIATNVSANEDSISPRADINISYASAIANGVENQITSDKLTLTFSEDVQDLSSDDLILSNNNVVKGNLTPLGNGVYELGISGSWIEGDLVDVSIVNESNLPKSEMPTISDINYEILSGSGIPNSQVDVYNHNSALICSVIVNDSSKWYCEPTIPVEDHTSFSAIQTEVGKLPSDSFYTSFSPPQRSLDTPIINYDIAAGTVISPETQQAILHKKAESIATEKSDGNTNTKVDKLTGVPTSDVNNSAKMALLFIGLLVSGGYLIIRKKIHK